VASEGIPDRIRQRAVKARQWADAADREEVEASGTLKREGWERGQRYAAISTAHSLAVLATIVLEDE
jgi:hypothetical protein